MAPRGSALYLKQLAVAQGTSNNVSSLPSPIGGWNARDSIANMPITDAVILENFFPNVSNVTLRGGFVNHATGLSGQVESLFSYNSGATEKLFAVDTSGKIYDVTAAGAVGAAEVTGLTNARWEHQNVTTAGGGYLYAVNGVDAPLLYDGSTWVSITGVSVPAITGVTTTTLDNVTLFKNRVWFVQKNTLKAWYLPTSAISGAAQALDLSSVAQLGGYIVGIGTWTVDAGYGVDDNLVFYTSRGEVIVYRGTDTSSAATWALAGVWSLGDPVAKRCMMKYGGDILLLSVDGLIPLAAALQSSRLDPRIALTDKIQGAFVAAAKLYGSNFGWQIFVFPEQNACWANVPVTVGTQQQYVMNTITKAWCNFTGWAANCWEHLNSEAYFGGNGVVGKAWDTGYADNVSDIATNALQAFDYFESRGVEKIFVRARPTIFSDGVPTVGIGINTDYDLSDTTAALTFSPTSAGLWDTGLWDTALWGSGLSVTNNWQGVTGSGYNGAVHLKSASQGIQIEWASTDVVYQAGWAGI